jgi:microcystin-dependent protein
MHLGEIKMCAFNFAPRGYALCDGRELAIERHRPLFELIGTIYGGDGVRTFCVPDLRGRAPMHMSKEPGRSMALGERKGEETVTLKQEEAEAASQGQLAAPVTHDNMQPFIALNFIIALYDDSSWDEPLMGEVRMFAGEAPPYGWYACDGRHLRQQAHLALFTLLGTAYGGNGHSAFRLPNVTGRVPIGAGAGVGLSPRELGAADGTEQMTPAAKSTSFTAVSQPHSNMGPYLVCTFIIAHTGLYPFKGE